MMMIAKLKCFVKQNAKAIAGFAGAAGVYIAAHIGSPLPAGAEVAIAGFVASFIVWLVPNTDCGAEFQTPYAPTEPGEMGSNTP